MITVNFYSIQKKENSTRQPSGSERTASFECLIKEPSGVLSPDLVLNLGPGFSPADYNYCYIPYFRRYYWVTDWTYDIGTWTASCAVDVLATYRSQIAGSSLYVLRAASEYDGQVIDGMYPYSTYSSFTKVTANSPWTFSPGSTTINIAGGSFVVGIAGIGYTRYYAFTYSNLHTLMQQISTDYVTPDNGFSEEDAMFPLQKSLIDPFSYIKSVRWLPVVYGSEGSAENGVYVGDFFFAVPCYFLNTSHFWRGGGVYFQIPRHPVSAARGSYLNASGSEYTVVFPPFGCISLSPDKCAMWSYVNCLYQIDYLAGTAICTIGYGNTAGVISEIETRVSSTIGADIQLSQLYRDYAGAAAGAVKAGASAGIAAALGNVAGAIAGGVSGIVDSAMSLKPRLDTFGSPGGFIGMNGEVALFAQFHYPVADDIEHHGRPLCGIRTLGNLSGYILVQDGDVIIPGTDQEARAVKAYLETGFFME